MAGLENLIGTGSAQVLPKGPSMMPIADQLNEQRQLRFQREKYNQAQKEQNEKELFGLVGDALNLKDFNPVIHDRVKKAQIELAQKIKNEKPSYADTYLLAQNKASELGQLSQGLNQLDQQIALTKKEYEGDKRINTGNLEMIARKKALDDLNTKGKVDPTKNYFDEALNDYPQFALTDNSDYTVTDFIPEEKQSLSGKFKETNRRGATDQFDWKAENYPAYYNFKDNGEEKSPEITTRSEPSGLLDANKNPVPMLSNDAYGRFKAKPSNVVAINRRLKTMYGDALDLRSAEAETLRKIEAYKEVDKYKPPINKSRIVKEAPAPRISVRVSTGGGNDIPAWDLSQYPDAPNGGKNLTVPFQGYTVTAIGKDKLLAKNVIYHPDTKEFEVTEYTGRDANGDPTGQKTSRINAKTFRQNIQGMNPGTDMKPFDALINKSVGGNTPAPPQPAKKEILRKDIKAKASAAGYSEKEYEALLKKNGITIKD